jgi:hypothetical protein
MHTTRCKNDQDNNKICLNTRKLAAKASFFVLEILIQGLTKETKQSIIVT